MFPNTVNLAMTLQTLVYFKGEDLERLPPKTRTTLIDAVRQVREVPLFSGTRVPIGTMPPGG